MGVLAVGLGARIVWDGERGFYLAAPTRDRLRSVGEKAKLNQLRQMLPATCRFKLRCDELWLDLRKLERPIGWSEIEYPSGVVVHDPK